MDQAIGKIVQIIGPVLDIRFEADQLPNIYDAVKIDYKDIHVVAEVMQHVGDNTVRAVSMSSTDGLIRGIDAVSTGAPISVPVGKPTLGRLINVVGQTIDEMGQIDEKDAEFWPIHRQAPAFIDQGTTAEMLETGIKVVDLIAPYSKGGKIGLFWWCRCW